MQRGARGRSLEPRSVLLLLAGLASDEVAVRLAAAADRGRARESAGSRAAATLARAASAGSPAPGRAPRAGERVRVRVQAGAPRRATA